MTPSIRPLYSAEPDVLDGIMDASRPSRLRSDLRAKKEVKFRIPSRLYRRLHMGRILEGKSISHMVEEALEAYLEKHSKIAFKEPEEQPR